MSEMVETALALSKMGPVFPLHSVQHLDDGAMLCTCNRRDCSDVGKHPMTRNGLSDATQDPERIRSWFTAWPRANLGLRTGRFFVVDVDPRHGGDDSLLELERRHGPLPHTARVLSGGGGEHIFFKSPLAGEIRNSANRVAAGIDIRGAGGYVVAPPSLHISGKRYAWSIDHHPDETPMAPPPEWLIEALKEPEAGHGRPAEEWVALIEDGVSEGGRNTTLTKLTGHLLRKYVDPEVVRALVRVWNEARCRPPLSDREVWTIVNSVAGKELRRREAQSARRG